MSFQLIQTIRVAFLYFSQLFDHLILFVGCLRLILNRHLKVVDVSFHSPASLIELSDSHQLILYLFLKLGIELFKVRDFLGVLIIHCVVIHLQTVNGEVKFLYLSIEFLLYHFK